MSGIFDAGSMNENINSQCCTRHEQKQVLKFVCVVFGLGKDFMCVYV